MRILTFNLGAEEFGFPLDNVTEVISFPKYTPIPDTIDYFLGFTSLRNQVIPLVDLRIRLKIEPTLTHETAVVICQHKNNFIGIVVDEIHTVVVGTEQELMKLSGGAADIGSEIVTYVLRKGEKLSLILDMEKILSANPEELARFQKQSEKLKETLNKNLAAA